MTNCWLFTTPSGDARVFVHARLWIEARKAAQTVLGGCLGADMCPLDPTTFHVPEGSEVVFVEDMKQHRFVTERPMSFSETRQVFEQMKRDEAAKAQAASSSPSSPSSPLIFPEISVMEGKLYVDSQFICRVHEDSEGDAAANLDAAFRAWTERSILT